VRETTNLPCIGYLRGRTTGPTTGRTKGPTFGMIPSDVSTDERLNHRDVRVYCIFSQTRRGPLVSIGERRVAVILRLKRRSVRASIAALVAAGHVEALPVKRGERARYRLTSPLFSAAVSVKAEVSEEKAVPLKREWVNCPKCGNKRPALLKVGWCRSCNADRRTELISERVSERVSRRVVKEEREKLA